MRDELIVVGAALIRDGRVLAAQRAAPAATRGRWEFPGGKTEAGETPALALVRECREELGVTVRAGARIGPDVPLTGLSERLGRPAVLRLLRAELVEGDPRPLEHLALRWVDPTRLRELDWLPADRPFLDPLARLLEADARPA
ncbi:NUDIX domain-containing protein [Nocardiopsis sp. MG754419]|uniref:(deoxy)nucleoside triphosphate pyrophosphohydrolase n=1 Tax=Nocardiopsis sp. MG754419 TaxID=2259865 RepID=UPI0027DD8EF3|nr:NUDIX domain-containing protein [Nocardiopsis sp. MG754419]MBR8744174.1 DNA mismatch repair protein MutT [Nocardiopsis sp. MG754419]